MTPKFNLFIEQVLLFLESEEMINELSPSDLYNFYYIATLVSMNKIQGEYANFIVKDFIPKLKSKYLRIFGELCYKQIKKYISRNRIDHDLTMELLEHNKDNYKMLDELMRKTFRSDMKGRNDVWNLITENLYKLSTSGSIKDICFYIDRLNNCIHNTNELIFSKFVNASKLMSAFDEIHNAPTLNAYKNKVAKDIRELENQ